jgi:hypothetical protein
MIAAASSIFGSILLFEIGAAQRPSLRTKKENPTVKHGVGYELVLLLSIYGSPQKDRIHEFPNYSYKWGCMCVVLGLPWPRWQNLAVHRAQLTLFRLSK